MGKDCTRHSGLASAMVATKYGPGEDARSNSVGATFPGSF